MSVSGEHTFTIREGANQHQQGIVEVVDSGLSDDTAEDLARGDNS
jgi:hypothetical protein